MSSRQVFRGWRLCSFAECVLSRVAITQVSILKTTLAVLAAQLCGDTRDVEEPILVLVLLVDGAHQGGGRREDLLDEDEDGLLGAELDALSDDVHELANGEVGGHEVLLLVDGRDVRLLDLLADDLRRDVSDS